MNDNDEDVNPATSAGSSSFSSVCILGCSGSGKTSLVKSLLKIDGRHVIVFNSNGEDYGDLDAEDREWNPDSLEDLQNCCVVFEDLIAPAPKKMATIKKVAHYFQRRRNVSLYILSHEIHHTGLYSLIGQMDKIYITSGPKNTKLYKDLAKFQFHIEPSTVEALKNKRFHYLEVNTKTGSYRVLNSKLEDVMDSLRNDLLAKRLEVEKCLKAFPTQCTILMQIFDIIFKNFSSSLLTPNDLCVPIKVGSAKSRTRKVPIIDFLLSLRLTTKPDRDVILLKRFMDSKLTLPRTLITNEYLRATNEPTLRSKSSRVRPRSTSPPSRPSSSSWRPPTRSSRIMSKSTKPTVLGSGDSRSRSVKRKSGKKSLKRTSTSVARSSTLGTSYPSRARGKSSRPLLALAGRTRKKRSIHSEHRRLLRSTSPHSSDSAEQRRLTIWRPRLRYRRSTRDHDDRLKISRSGPIYETNAYSDDQNSVRDAATGRQRIERDYSSSSEYETGNQPPIASDSTSRLGNDGDSRRAAERTYNSERELGYAEEREFAEAEAEGERGMEDEEDEEEDEEEEGLMAGNNDEEEEEDGNEPEYEDEEEDEGGEEEGDYDD